MNVIRDLSSLTGILSLPLMLLLGCSGNGPSGPSTGSISGQVTDAESSSPLANVRIFLYEAGTNAARGSYVTGSDGRYNIEQAPGSYYLKMARQGYENIPPGDIAPLSLNILADYTVDYSVSMFRSPFTNTGSIHGRVTLAGDGIPNVLIVADSAGQGFSALSDVSGDFFIFNIPASTYLVRAWRAGYASSQDTVNVSPGVDVTGRAIVLTAGATGTVSGQITFLATTNIEVDVALLNLSSREVVPGLTASTVNGDFSIANVPYGSYLARATYKNDGKVMDPDWIVKNGEPVVTVSSAAADRDFSVTGAVTILAPTNSADNVQPVPVHADSLSFSWNAYPSADDYVIEVTDQSGRVVWGGFSPGWATRRVVIPKTSTSVDYNADGNAIDTLATGKIYRWRIYASKDDGTEPSGWKLISASEDQRGLMKIVR